ncbi:hypothetical protein [Nocardia sp. NPDC004123]
MNATADGIAVQRRGHGTAPAIEIRGLVKTFAAPGGTVRAVDALDLTVRPGEIVSKLVPTNGIAVLARAPFAQPSAAGIVLAIVNVLTWAAVFTLGSAYLFRRDTAR